MKKKFSFWGAILIFVLSLVLHSLFEITSLDIFKPISPINDSVWEHMKMMFFAGFIYYLFKVIFSRGKNLRNSGGYAVSLIVMVLIVPMLFYTYTNILGSHYLVVDIIISFIAALAGEFIAFKLSPRYDYSPNGFVILLASLAILAMAFMFVYLTYYPLNTPIFIE